MPNAMSTWRESDKQQDHKFWNDAACGENLYLQSTAKQQKSPHQHCLNLGGDHTSAGLCLKKAGRLTEWLGLENGYLLW